MLWLTTGELHMVLTYGILTHALSQHTATPIAKFLLNIANIAEDHMQNIL